MSFLSPFIEQSRAAWTRFFGKQIPPSEPQGPFTTDPDELAYIALVKDFPSIYRVEKGREQRLRDLYEMDTGDLASLLDVTVEAAITFEDDEPSDDPLLNPEGFKIMFPNASATRGRAAYGSQAVRAVFEQVLRDTRVRSELGVYGRDMLKYGDAFCELVPRSDDDKTIVKVQHKLVPEMKVNRDIKGRLRRDTDINGNPLAYQQWQPNAQVVAGWYPEEMVHFKLYPDSAFGYSVKGLLDDLRPDWRKLSAVEQGMIIARVVRAYPRLLHVLDMTNKGDKEAKSLLRQYIQGVTTKAQPDGTMKKTDMAVDEDYFMTTGFHTQQDGRLVGKLNDLKVLDPNISGLGNIGDIDYTRGKLFTRMPAELIGVMRNNGVELTQQDIAYGRMVRRIQLRLEDGIRQLLDNALLRAEVTPVPYRLVWPKVQIGSNWKWADSRFRSSMADRNDLEMGVTSRELIMRERGLSEAEIQQVKDEWEAYQKDLASLDAQAAGELAKITADANPSSGKAVTGQAPKKAGNTTRRTAGKTIKTTGVGQGAQGAKSGG